MSEIVSLRGERIEPPGEPNAAVVKLAEEALERAKSGDLRGLHLVFYHSDDTHVYRSAGELAMATIGCVERLKNWLCHRMDEG